MLIPQALVFLASASSAPRLVHPLRGDRVIATGLGLLATSMLLMTPLDASSSVYAVIFVTLVTAPAWD